MPPLTRPCRPQLRKPPNDGYRHLGALMIAVLLGLALAMGTYALHRERQLLQLQHQIQ